MPYRDTDKGIKMKYSELESKVKRLRENPEFTLNEENKWAFKKGLCYWGSKNHKGITDPKEIMAEIERYSKILDDKVGGYLELLTSYSEITYLACWYTSELLPVEHLDLSVRAYILKDQSPLTNLDQKAWQLYQEDKISLEALQVLSGLKLKGLWSI